MKQYKGQCRSCGLEVTRYFDFDDVVAVDSVCGCGTIYTLRPPTGFSSESGCGDAERRSNQRPTDFPHGSAIAQTSGEKNGTREASEADRAAKSEAEEPRVCPNFGRYYYCGGKLRKTMCKACPRRGKRSGLRNAELSDQ